MKQIVLYTFSLILLSASCDNNQGEGELTYETEFSSKIEECFHLKFDNYYHQFDMISDILFEDFEIEESINSYSLFLEKIHLDSFEISVKLGEMNKKILDPAFFDNNVMYKIHTCTQLLEFDTTISKSQRNYFAVFNEAAVEGFVNNLKLARCLNELNEEEFNKFGVKEITLFYIFNYLLLNIYSH